MPWILFYEPEGMREMVEGNHGLNVVADKYVDNVLVMGYCPIIPDVRPRLYPAPLQGEPVGIHPKLFEEGEVFFIEAIVAC
jgi:hypothetical protein